MVALAQADLRLAKASVLIREPLAVYQKLVEILERGTLVRAMCEQGCKLAQPLHFWPKLVLIFSFSSSWASERRRRQRYSCAGAV